MKDIYDKTVEKSEALREVCSSYEEYWECQFDEMKKNNIAFSNFLKTIDFQEPLNVRDAFFGGRTNCTSFYYQTKEGEKILYMDITSLYPFINKTSTYPIKHPVLIHENFNQNENGEYDITEYFGVIKCKILPPRGLYHPVLPQKIRGKLMFVLCRTCSETTQQTPCTHSETQRELLGTWVTEEVKKAVEKGYKIRKVYEVWHYPEKLTYNKETGQEGLMSGYVNKFLKIKQEASGWPEWVKNEQDQEKYIQDYYEREGILLEPKNIKKNASLRTIGKTILNNFWGRLGIREQFNQAEYIKEPKRLFHLLLSDTIEVSDMSFVNEGMVFVQYKENKNFIQENPEASIIHACFTTAWARLYLYQTLEKLDQRVLYYDTDSVIFIQENEDQWKPQISSFLGDYTDELDGGYITTFVSGGPKNYSYKTNDGTTSVKVKGITLNHRSSQKINLESMLDLITHTSLDNGDQTIETTEPYKIVRDVKRRKIESKPMTKKYRFCYDKRAIRKDYKTVPFGY
jgi:hypothetical protein